METHNHESVPAILSCTKCSEDLGSTDCRVETTDREELYYGTRKACLEFINEGRGHYVIIDNSDNSKEYHYAH